MANRFLDTNYYKSPFVRSLQGALKSLYSFIICDCDGAGIWNLDLAAASLYIGFEINMLEFEDYFVKKDKAIPIGNNKYFFPDFIEHQYPSGLQENNTAHKNFIKTLKKFNLIDESLNVRSKGALKGLESLIGIGNGNGQGIGQGNTEVLNEKLLCPKMLKIMKKHIPTYGEDINRDYQPLYSIGQYIFTHGDLTGTLLESTESVCKEWESICVWLKDDSFYSQKSLKTISNHIQEIVNKAKNGSRKNGKELSEYEKKVEEDREKARNKKYE